MFEIVDGRTDAGVTGILLAHPWAFGSGELIKSGTFAQNKLVVHFVGRKLTCLLAKSKLNSQSAIVVVNLMLRDIIQKEVKYAWH